MEVILHFPHKPSLEEEGVREPKERAHSVEDASAGSENKGQHPFLRTAEVQRAGMRKVGECRGWHIGKKGRQPPLYLDNHLLGAGEEKVPPSSILPPRDL